MRERKSMMEGHEGGSGREETAKEESTWGGMRWGKYAYKRAERDRNAQGSQA